MADQVPMERPFKKVLIVGAGPSGLLLAVLLARHGVPVEVLEAAGTLDASPRAAVYGAPAMPDLARAPDVLAAVRRRGLVTRTMSWWRRDGGDAGGDDAGGGYAKIAAADCDVLRDVDGLDCRLACLVLDQLTRLLLDELAALPAAVRWHHRVVRVGQDDARAWVDVQVPEGGEEGDPGGSSSKERRLEADYVVGCDGGSSTVRKSLFGDEFPGFTWDRPVMATNVYYDFGKFGFDDANFILHPEHFFMAARLTADGLWRVSYGEDAGLTREQMEARQPWKFETMLPGRPTPADYKMVGMSPYKMHQRCAPAFRRGRVLLAADAAHLCNPWGGLGITGGFVDVGGLYDCLAGMWDGRADASILDLYSDKRVDKWRSIIDPVSQDNFRRVCDPDPASLTGRDPVLRALEQATDDPVLSRQLQMAAFATRYDFTQHYKTA